MCVCIYICISDGKLAGYPELSWLPLFCLNRKIKNRVADLGTTMSGSENKEFKNNVDKNNKNNSSHSLRPLHVPGLTLTSFSILVDPQSSRQRCLAGIKKNKPVSRYQRGDLQTWRWFLPRPAFQIQMVAERPRSFTKFLTDSKAPRTKMECRAHQGRGEVWPPKCLYPMKLGNWWYPADGHEKRVTALETWHLLCSGLYMAEKWMDVFTWTIVLECLW